MFITGYLSKNRTHIIYGDKQFGSWKDAIFYDRYVRGLRLIKSVAVL